MTFLKCQICGQRMRTKPNTNVYRCEHCGTEREIYLATTNPTEKVSVKRTVVARLSQSESVAPRLNVEPRQRVRYIALFSGITICIAIIIILLWFFFIAPFGQYREAQGLMERGFFEDAYILFDELGDFMDSPHKAQECKMTNEYNLATQLMNEGKYQEAIDTYTKLGGYGDSASKIIECNMAICEMHYNEAVSLKNKGELEEAYNLFRQIGEYKDSTDLASKIRITRTMDALEKADVGDYVPFGVYEQDGNDANGAEDIEWRILAKEGNKVLLISKYALKKQLYWETNQLGTNTFANSSVRKWLNDVFLNSAFGTTEQDKIVRTTISSGKYTEVASGLIFDSDIDGSPDLVEKEDIRHDKLFLLSVDEVEKYFDSSDDRRCQLTPYAQGKGTSDDYCRWWLRGNFSGQYVTKDGTIPNGKETDESGDRVFVATASIAVRPALWIELD